MNDLQYMALSQLAYTNLPTTERVEAGNSGSTHPWTMLELIQENMIEGVDYDQSTHDIDISKPELSALSSLSSYTLLQVSPPTTSGFYAAAFQALS